MNAGQVLESLALLAGGRTRKLLVLTALFTLMALALTGCELDGTGLY